VQDNPKYCTTLGFIPKTKLTYAMPTSWKGIQRYFSNHAWSMDIIAVWNKEAQQRLTDASPNWLQTLQRSIPEAVWEQNQYLAREDTDHITNHVRPQYFKSKREDVTGQERGQNTNVHLQPWDDKQFDLKCPNWNLWAYTDGSCIGKAENFLGTGVYCPQTKLNVMWTQEAWEWQKPSIELSSQGLQQRLPISIPRLRRTVHAP